MSLAERTVSHEQAKRVAKLFTDEFFVIGSSSTSTSTSTTAATTGRDTTNDDCIKLLISGSKRDVYTTEIRSRGRRCACSCLDMRMHARRHGCFCKHICFVWFKILQANSFDLFVENGDLPRIDVANVHARLASATATSNNPASDLDEMSRSLSSLVLENFLSTNGTSFAVTKTPSDQDDCPICFDAFVATPTLDLVGCPTCKNNVHVKCVLKWLHTNANKTCVYCRSPAWKSFRC